MGVAILLFHWYGYDYKEPVFCNSYVWFFSEYMTCSAVSGGIFLHFFFT